MSGLEGFHDLLKEYTALLGWAVATAALPFMTGLAGFAPPWPPGVQLLTALVGLLVLVLVYQLLRASLRKRTNRTVLIGAGVFVVACVVYSVLFSLFVFEIPAIKQNRVKGFICTLEAQQVFASKCPFLDLDELSGAQFEAGRLWTAPSIAAMRTMILADWLVMFGALAAVFGSFVVFQSNQPPRRRNSNHDGGTRS